MHVMDMKWFIILHQKILIKKGTWIELLITLIIKCLSTLSIHEWDKLLT